MGRSETDIREVEVKRKGSREEEGQGIWEEKEGNTWKEGDLPYL